MAYDNIDKLIAELGEHEQGDMDGGPSENIDSDIREFEWLISPDQFVDFWVLSIFLLVGTWQVITMVFLLLQ